LPLDDLVQPLLQPPLNVLEREIQHIAVDWPLVAEHKPVLVGSRQAHVEGEPRFPTLGLPARMVMPSGIRSGRIMRTGLNCFV